MSLNAPPKASHFINGTFTEDDKGQEINVIYPATGEVIATLHSATPALIEQALAAAKAAQCDWAARPGVERGRILRRAADLIRARNDSLSRLETLDTGKPLQETLIADPTSAADALEYFGGMAASFSGEHINLGGDFAYTIREALGVCVGIGAWNYPMQIAAWKSAPALACGNAVVFKPSETTPLTALALADIYREAGLPDGLFNVLQGMGDVGAALVNDARVAKVSLTGSVPTGQKVYAAAAAGMRNVTMELGGKSPILIFADADLDSAVSAAINGNFYASGQVCSNGTRVFVQKQMVEPFLARLLERMKGVRMGDPLDPDTNFGPMVSARQRAIVLEHIARGKAEGARLVTGGTAVEGPGFFLTPAVFADVRDDMHIARTEIFGPVMSVLSFEDEQEAVTRANNSEFGLSGAVFTRDITRAHRVAAALQAGSVWINQYNLTPVEVPFGGTKLSGVGRENGRIAVEHYSQLKTVYVGMSPVEAAY